MKTTVTIDCRRAYPLGRRFHLIADELKESRQLFHRNASAGLHSGSSTANFERYHRELGACCNAHGILLALARLLGRKVALKVPVLADVISTTETGRALPEGTTHLDRDE